MNDTVPQPGLDVAHFKYDGRTYTICKRTAGRDARWYLKFERRGKRIHRCLDSTIKENAIITAKIIIDQVYREDWDSYDRSRLRGALQEKLSAIGKVIEFYEKMPLELKASTRRQNVNCLRNILSQVKTGDVDALSTKILAPDLARTYFDLIISRSAAAANQEEAARMKRSANSIFMQARSLFTPRCVAAYRRAGLLLPDLNPFLNAWRSDRFRRVSTVHYAAPSDGLIETTLQKWAQLDDRNMFLAIGHELAFGLRKGEITQARWNWHTVIEGHPFLDGRADVKGGGGHVVVRGLDPFWTTLQNRIAEKNWRATPEASILEGTDTDRKENIFNAVSSWMRSLGWETQKTNHALRAYAGSQVAMRFGIYSCSTWLRHRSVTVTQQHYTHFVEVHKLDDPTKLAAKWAIAPELEKPANIIHLQIATQ